MGPGNKRNIKYLGCAVLYYSVFPCTLYNNASFEKHRKSIAKAQKS